MKIILDTCILSELQKQNGEIKVQNAVKEIPQENVYISVITIGEIYKGISLLADGKRKRQLNLLLESIISDAYHSILV